MKTKLGIIGCGHMGTALVRGLRRAHYPVLAFDSDPGKREAARRMGAQVAGSNAELVRKRCSVLLAVKPQQLAEVLAEIRLPLPRSSLLVSIAAGIPTSWIERRVGKGIHVVRVMPNLPAQQGQGMSALCGGQEATRSELQNVTVWLGTVGSVVEVPEELMNAVTAVSGSGPAYFFYLIEQMVTAGVELGLSKQVALTLAAKTAEGAALMARGGAAPEVLRRSVASKGGTTEAALNVFEKRKVAQALREGIKAAARRAKELSR